jgi:hypothetical protein
MSSSDQRLDQTQVGDVGRRPGDGGVSANTSTDGAINDGLDGSTTERGESTSASASDLPTTDSTNTNTDGADRDTQNTMASSLRPATQAEREYLFGTFKDTNTDGSADGTTPADGNAGSFDPPYKFYEASPSNDTLDLGDPKSHGRKDL